MQKLGILRQSSKQACRPLTNPALAKGAVLHLDMFQDIATWMHTLWHASRQLQHDCALGTSSALCWHVSWDSISNCSMAVTGLQPTAASSFLASTFSLLVWFSSTVLMMCLGHPQGFGHCQGGRTCKQQHHEQEWLRTCTKPWPMPSMVSSFMVRRSSEWMMLFRFMMVPISYPNAIRPPKIRTLTCAIHQITSIMFCNCHIVFLFFLKPSCELLKLS